MPPKLIPVFFRRTHAGEVAYVPSRYKVAYGGRGSAKSWSFAGVAVYLASQFKLRIVCARELQNSIKESVHQLMKDRITQLGLPISQFGSPGFIITDKKITHTNGSEIIFVGLKSDPGKLKSLEGADILFIEEAEKISETSWRTIIPTIRAAGSEIWIVFNPREETDPTYKRFVLREPPFCRRVKINFDENPWFPRELEIERLDALKQINEAVDDEERAQLQADYDHVWLGECQQHSNATIFRKRVVIHEFDDPHPDTQTVYKYGTDWGFSVDPIAHVRFFITEHKAEKPDEKDWEELWITHAEYAYGCELDHIERRVFDKVPESKRWPIKADCARPETISHMRRVYGYNITGAEKWDGSVEDGIEHIRAYRKIHIHKRCTGLQQEARLYKYKVDKVTGEVLPIVVDKHNHGWDAIRYGLDGVIQRRGAKALWQKLAQ